MLPSEKLAIAAHLHVLLRRKTGRVTDTEWLATNAEYATEIVRFARARAKEDGHADLAEWADKLVVAMASGRGSVATASPRTSTDASTLTAPQARAPSVFALFRGGATQPAEPTPLPEAGVGSVRYVNGIR